MKGSFQLACVMTSSIKSQSIALRSSYSVDSSSSDGSIHCTLPYCATGVSPSPGGPGGGGLLGRGRTRSGAEGNAVSDPSSSIGGEYIRDAGLRVAEDRRCGVVGGSITFGRCGRGEDDEGDDDDVGGGDRRETGVVCGGDHAGGGDLGRDGGGELVGSEVGGGGGDFGILGSGRDLPKELVDALIWLTITINTSHGETDDLVRLPSFHKY